MKIIIFYIFLILIFIPILFNIVFITRTVEGFKVGKKNKEYKLVGDKKNNHSYSFLYGTNTIKILTSNKKNKITDMYFLYESLPNQSITTESSFDDISKSEFIVKTLKNKYNIIFSSSETPIKIIINDTEYEIRLKKKDKEGKFDIIWYDDIVAGTIDGFDINISENKLDDVEIVMVLYTAILIIQKMKDLDNIDYNKMFK